MRPVMAAFVFGGALGGPPMLAQAVPNLSWLTIPVSVLGSLFVARVALQWKREDEARASALAKAESERTRADAARADAAAEHGRRLDESLSSHGTAIADLKHEIESLRKRAHDLRDDLIAIKMMVKTFPCRSRGYCPEEST